ncbi:MAG TPA: DUF3006 domain-containing protein [Clostridiales bacterium]|nr:DUF3006 domain-containing protein [Clostridiales bacterium]
MKAVIDRIENNTAVVLFGEEEIAVNIPLILLPDGAKEGSILKVNLELDTAAELQQREKISRLLEKLKNKNHT